MAVAHEFSFPLRRRAKFYPSAHSQNIRRLLSQASSMSESGSIVVEIERPGLKAHGILKKGNEDLRSLKPLIVLIHGGGCNASYFDNDFHS
jgi:hypothetical protein